LIVERINYQAPIGMVKADTASRVNTAVTDNELVY